MMKNPGKLLFGVLKVVGQCQHGTSVEKFIYFKLKTMQVSAILKGRSGQFEGQIKEKLGDNFAFTIDLDDEWEEEFSCQNLASILIKQWAGSDPPEEIVMGPE